MVDFSVVTFEEVSELTSRAVSGVILGVFSVSNE